MTVILIILSITINLGRPLCMYKRKLPNWIESYLTYTEDTEPPLLYKKWTAISTIAAALQRKVWLPWDRDTYPNMFVVLVGPSGCRKGTAMAPAYKLLTKTGIKLSSDSITREGLIEQMSSVLATSITDDGRRMEHCSLTVYSEEFAVFLGYQQKTLIMALTDWYDCKDPWIYTTKGSGDAIIPGTWVNLIGAITPTLLQDTLTSEAATGGLAGRTIFVYAGRKGKSIACPFQSSDNKHLFADLESDLAKIHMLTGNYTITEDFLKIWTEWYNLQEISPPFTDDRFDGYIQRRAKHLLKLCMIFSAARSDDMIISAAIFKSALALLSETEKIMPKAFRGVGKSDIADVTDRVVEYIKVKKNHQTNMQELLNLFPHDADYDTMSKVVLNLKMRGLVENDEHDKSIIRLKGV